MIAPVYASRSVRRLRRAALEGFPAQDRQHPDTVLDWQAQLVAVEAVPVDIGQRGVSSPGAPRPAG
ncbi:MAG TPA: hypothetical protein VFA49_03305, partial [Chloroflexota bacterium]|nr:hypothetical protein [Chloroflexota bacterium]